MEVVEIAPGLWRWTAYHDEWKQAVGSVYVETEDGVVLIDPLVPPGESDRVRLWQALDRDVKRVGGAVHVLVTVYWHTRSAPEIMNRYRARLWAHAKAQKTVGRRAGSVTDPFEAGDPLPGGIQAYVGRWSEVVYWLPGDRTLVTGDVILGAKGGGLRFCPESWTPTAGGHAAWRDNLRPLLDLPVERVLVSHGEPVLAGGLEALEPLFRD
jgi:glyoxylase-like metal-dependent hydrolase (beta-lactamase superfamily II)